VEPLYGHYEHEHSRFRRQVAINQFDRITFCHSMLSAPQYLNYAYSALSASLIVLFISHVIKTREPCCHQWRTQDLIWGWWWVGDYKFNQPRGCLFVSSPFGISLSWLSQGWSCYARSHWAYSARRGNQHLRQLGLCKVKRPYVLIRCLLSLCNLCETKTWCRVSSYTGIKTRLFSTNKSTTSTERTAHLRTHCIQFTGKIINK